MQYLIDQGADINCSNQDGDVPIHEAFCSGNFDAIDLLLSLEANPNTQNNDGKTSLHWMLMNKSLDAQKKIAVIKNILIYVTLLWWIKMVRLLWTMQ